LAMRGAHDHARSALTALQKTSASAKFHALLENDLGTLEALAGDIKAARRHFSRAVDLDVDCRAAHLNLEQLGTEAAIDAQAASAMPASILPAPVAPSHLAKGAARVAILSTLFNWPSTGGGTVHTAESAKFLQKAGYHVRHFYAQYPDWGVGNVTQPLEVDLEPIAFDADSWNAPEIQRRFRAAVDRFSPDYIIITDSWNSKPILAEAMRGYRYFLRLAALECLCPLNNVRLLFDGGKITSCTRHQLATADVCRQCVASRAHLSGALHRAERALVGYGSLEYDAQLRRAFAEAEGVLVVNPLIAAMVSPYAKSVHVLPSGFDPDRFPWPWPDENGASGKKPLTQIFFAGLVTEYMKGFHVLHAACRKLWAVRQDFELVATADPVQQVDPFTRYIGWLSQDELPQRLRDADLLVFPTIAEEALGRSVVEAMGAGRPVIASRIGGLPFTVTEGTTGLLFEPGNANELAAKIGQLLDDRLLREQLGRAGRKKFEEQYTWPSVIERGYQPLLARPAAAPEIPFAPIFPEKIDEVKVVAETAEFLGYQPEDVARMLAAYRNLHEKEGYASRFGEMKTLAFEEAFILCVLCSLVRPKTIVEIGAQQGRSTRRIVDFKNWLGLACPVVSYDTTAEVIHATRDEVDLHCEDLTGRFRQEVLEKNASGMIFLDAHPYRLLEEAITETLAFPGEWALAIHDCSPGICNPHMTLSKDDPQISSHTGIWERHILAEAFGVADPLDPQLEKAATATHKLRIFSTRHGLGLIVPAHLGHP
jgi:glycosyltransferase involved in cell wall biosynthesis